MADSTIELVPDETVVPVRNLLNHRVAYVLDSGVRRRFAPNATINIEAKELRELSYQPGGTELLTNYLSVGNANLAQEFGVDPDTVEYNWTEQDIVDAVTTADTDVLLDALDYAPEAIKSTIVEKAVELEIPDNNRRAAIKNATGADVTKMIEVKHAYDDTSVADEDSKPAGRRVQKNASEKKSSSGRRTAAKKVEQE